MSVFVIGDLHFSVAAKKPMDIFPGWDDHAEKIIENWEKTVKPDDTVVLCGDTPWGMTLPEAVPDFRLIHRLPGKKLVLKGNHDYWWTSMTKMNSVLFENDLTSISILHNNSYPVEGIVVCGSRGWMFETGERHDDKIIAREAIRIEASLKNAQIHSGEKVLFLHYPPVYAGQVQRPFISLMQRYGIKRCYYGHIHGAGRRFALQGGYQGIQFTMVSCDAVGFRPVKVETQAD